ncbi:hypothetical protein SAMN04488118_10276 [Epibacterium ulvae]|uniref:Uncharacterized protein n=1 Tax=Epibacterium ulvae TaxID=1156985 RepID=A0A1G5PUU0_9RHOB|nr:hypothetical protein SAMN04488118_10276 [Epibacterium ulvae]
MRRKIRLCRYTGLHRSCQATRLHQPITYDKKGRPRTLAGLHTQSNTSPLSIALPFKGGAVASSRHHRARSGRDAWPNGSRGKYLPLATGGSPCFALHSLQDCTGRIPAGLDGSTQRVGQINTGGCMQVGKRQYSFAYQTFVEATLPVDPWQTP